MSSPTDSQDGPQHKSFNHSSVALICAFIICFSFFFYVSSKIPRVSQPAHPVSSTARPYVQRQRKPKLWEVWLDSDLPLTDDHQGCMSYWHPVAAWADDGPNPHYPRQNSLRPELTQTWFPSAYSFRPEGRGAPPPPPSLTVSDPPKLNVAILVAMPSPQKDAQPVRSGLSYHEGQLSFGVRSLSQAMRRAPREYDWTTL